LQSLKLKPKGVLIVLVMLEKPFAQNVGRNLAAPPSPQALLQIINPSNASNNSASSNNANNSSANSNNVNSNNVSNNNANNSNDANSNNANSSSANNNSANNNSANNNSSVKESSNRSESNNLSLKQRLPRKSFAVSAELNWTDPVFVTSVDITMVLQWRLLLVQRLLPPVQRLQLQDLIKLQNRLVLLLRHPKPLTLPGLLMLHLWPLVHLWLHQLRQRVMVLLPLQVQKLRVGEPFWTRSMQAKSSKRHRSQLREVLMDCQSGLRKVGAVVVAVVAAARKRLLEEQEGEVVLWICKLS